MTPPHDPRRRDGTLSSSMRTRGLPRLRHDWTGDFDAMMAGVLPGYDDAPYAFARYGDGEAAIISERPYRTKADGWTYPGGYSDISKYLATSLMCSLPGYYIGLPSPTFEPKHLEELLRFVRLPHECLTWSKIFIDTNHKRFKALLSRFIDHCMVVSSAPGADVLVPSNGVNPFCGDAVIDHCVDEVRGATCPILVAAGPLSNLIIYRYWSEQAPECRQTIIDVGSAIDEHIKGRGGRVRKYSKLEHRRRDWVPFIGGVPDV